MPTVLSFDLGATSARGIIFSLSNGNITEEKIYRFTDYQVVDKKNKSIHWNINRMISEIKRIITLASSEFTIQSIGFDTWGCDFGLLDKQGELIMLPLCYQTMFKKENMRYGMDLPSIFQERTGIPNSPINTSSQLLYLKDKFPKELDKAEHLLMMPDLIQYLLTGEIWTESSIASTSQLFDIDKHQWALDLVKTLGVSTTLFSTVVLPYTQIGSININNTSILVHSVMEHDTASAIFALPSNDHSCSFISSGTWSVLGEKSEKGILIKHPLDSSYSYEQAGDGKILKIKNILGMWFIEEAIKFVNKDQNISIEQVQDMLINVEPISFYFDNQDPYFFDNGDFVNKLKEYGDIHQFPSINEPHELFLIIYQNLAFKYTDIFESLTPSIAKRTIYLFGGGSKSNYLTQLTADLTDTTIAVCYSENSALGNALAQFLAIDAIKNREELINIVKENYPPTYFYPKAVENYKNNYFNYKQFIRGN